MLSPEEVQKLPTDLHPEATKRWDAYRIKRTVMLAGAAGIAGLGIIEGFLPHDKPAEERAAIADLAWPVDAPDEMLAGDNSNDRSKELREITSQASTYDPSEAPRPIETAQRSIDAADLSFPEGVEEFSIVPEDVTQLLIVPAAENPTPALEPAQKDYRLAR